jgi:prefoldin beta subunit
MSEIELPPQFQERLARLQQLQQTLQIVITEKQRLELEFSETERALKELKGLGDEDVVYKSVGSLLIKSNRRTLIKELEERKELLNTRIMVLARQEERTRVKVRELQRSIQEELGRLRRG